MFRTALFKLLLAITVSAMVALAVMGGYVVALKSQDNPILAPVHVDVQHVVPNLPNQAPVQTQAPSNKRYVMPGSIDPDSPSPK